MPSGLQIYDASGRTIVDFTTRLSRILGNRVINGLGSLTDPHLAQGDPFIQFQPNQIFGFINMDVSRPIFTVSGTSISWSYSPGAGSNNFQITGTMFYGVK